MRGCFGGAGGSATANYNERGGVNANSFGVSNTTVKQEHKPKIEMVIVGMNAPDSRVLTYKSDFLIKNMKKHYKIK